MVCLADTELSLYQTETRSIRYTITSSNLTHLVVYVASCAKNVPVWCRSTAVIQNNGDTFLLSCHRVSMKLKGFHLLSF